MNRFKVWFVTMVVLNVIVAVIVPLSTALGQVIGLALVTPFAYFDARRSDRRDREETA